MATTHSTTPTRLEQFITLNWYHETIKFLFSFTSASSELLVRLGLVYSTADVLAGKAFHPSPFITNLWAYSQGIALETSGGILIAYSIEAFKDKDKVKGVIYLVLTLLLKAKKSRFLSSS